MLSESSLCFHFETLISFPCYANLQLERKAHPLRHPHQLHQNRNRLLVEAAARELKKGNHSITFLLPLVESSDSWSYSYISPAARAVLYSPDTKVPRTGEVALRRAIPANPNMKAIQIAIDEKDSILASIPAELKEKGSLVHASLIDGKWLGFTSRGCKMLFIS